ncbi:TetR/AcrR family transcriptional regulator [Alcanivorax sp. JB21]|uniref:TetR/AcrR family transcriptional regulator n=1 Tax=Alcanivorax limicola TaxID=2874102 RepID=UPI001CBC9743|nr:TetR/AcrR family transcriptional regulator [Alcanivorax limicola]MBZ2188266.1 TetR/AcrR family transcriptional regulator [Alcanivorax limicola]
MPSDTRANPKGNAMQSDAVPARAYQGASAKERARGRRQRLLDAAFVMLADDGWRQMTIDKLCRHAGLNKRYFYESFATLDDLAAAVVDDICEQLVAIAFDAARRANEAGRNVNELAHETLDVVVGFLLDDPRRARVLFTEVSDSPRAAAHRKNAIKGLASALAAYGHEHHQASGAHPVADVASALLVGGSIEVILSWLDGGVALTRQALIEDLAALWVCVGEGAVLAGKARAPQE